MQEKHIFEYAIIRVVPRVEREEFLNIGVVLYCPKKKFLQVRYHMDEARLHMLDRELNLEELKNYLVSFERICCGEKDSGPIALLDPASRFRWLTAMRSTMLQTSRIHPGISSDPEKTLDRLYEQMVG